MTAREAVHDVIFLDDDSRYMYDVDHKVRFINAEDYYTAMPPSRSIHSLPESW